VPGVAQVRFRQISTPSVSRVRRFRPAQRARDRARRR
jgi:hypothetical protein